MFNLAVSMVDVSTLNIGSAWVGPIHMEVECAVYVLTVSYFRVQRTSEVYAHEDKSESSEKYITFGLPSLGAQVLSIGKSPLSF